MAEVKDAIAGAGHPRPAMIRSRRGGRSRRRHAAPARAALRRRDRPRGLDQARRHRLDRLRGEQDPQARVPRAASSTRARTRSSSSAPCQSNAARATAAFAAATGRPLRAWWSRPRRRPCRRPAEGNALLSAPVRRGVASPRGGRLGRGGGRVRRARGGARARQARAARSCPRAARRRAARSASSPRTPSCWRSWRRRSSTPTAIVHASSSCGTAAGLLLGRALHGGPPIVSVDVGRLFEPVEERILRPGRGRRGRCSAMTARVGRGRPRRDLRLHRRRLRAARRGSASRRSGCSRRPRASSATRSTRARRSPRVAQRARGSGPVVFWHTGGAPVRVHVGRRRRAAGADAVASSPPSWVAKSTRASLGACGRRTPGSSTTCSYVKRTKGMPAIVSDASRARSSLRRLGERCQRNESASTTSGTSGQKKSRTRPATTTLVAGRGSPVRLAQLEAQLLEPAPHVDRSRRVPPEHLPQCRRSGLPGREERLEIREVEQLVHRSVDHGLEPHAAQAGRREVEDGPRRRGDREPVQPRDVRGGQGTAAMKADARASEVTAAADADVHAGRRRRADLPGMRGAEVAQHRVVTAREHRRPPAPQRRRRPGGRRRTRRGRATWRRPEAIRRSIWRCVSPAATSCRRAATPPWRSAIAAMIRSGADFTTHTVV